MKKLILLCLTISFGSLSRAQSISYDLSAIPDSIKKNAEVIVQYEKQIFSVENIENATLKVRSIYTIAKEEGRHALRFSEYHTKFMKLTDAEIKVFDATGKQISRYKKKDMVTFAVGEGLVEDGSVTSLVVSASNLPVTIDVEYEKKFEGTLFFPTFHIMLPHIGVSQSSYTAIIPSSLDLRYKEKNIQLKPDVKDDGKTKTYTWVANNLRPMEFEEGAVGSDDGIPSIELAPNKFSIYGYTGDLSSWKNYGLWLQQLYKGLDQLSEGRKAFFVDLVKDAKTEKEKIWIIYKYLQQNFRYVSIQLGIGGLKPFSAEFTDQKKYGDCKALSNYMKAALNCVGIKSNIAIINSGYNSLPVDPGFPQQGFNHVILCIPQKNDSIWLECTSSTADFGILSTFTENRYALLVTDDGGVLVPTPKSDAHANQFSVYSKIKLNEDGSGVMESTFHSAGEFREMMDEILTQKKDEQKESLVLGLSFKQPDEFELSKKDNSEYAPAVLKMSIEKVPEFSAGSKQFLPQRLYKVFSRKLPRAENRRLDYYFRYPYEAKDTTVYQLPAGYKADALPPTKEFRNEFASFVSKSWYDEGQNSVYTTVEIILKQHVIPAAKYAEVKKFFDDVLANEGQKVVVKKE